VGAIDAGKWRYHGRTENHIRAHIQEIPENGSDIAHLNVLHTSFFLPSLSHLFRHEWQATWEPGLEAHRSMIVIQERITCGGVYVPLTSQDGVIEQTGPGLVYLNFKTLFGNVVVFETVTPLGPLYQKAEHTVWAEPKVPRFFCKFLLRVLIDQFERDVPIWSNKTYNVTPMLVKGDGNISQFRRWFSRFYSENSPTLESLQKQTLDW